MDFLVREIVVTICICCEIKPSDWTKRLPAKRPRILTHVHTSQVLQLRWRATFWDVNHRWHPERLHWLSAACRACRARPGRSILNRDPLHLLLQGDWPSDTKHLSLHSQDWRAFRRWTRSYSFYWWHIILHYTENTKVCTLPGWATFFSCFV